MDSQRLRQQLDVPTRRAAPALIINRHTHVTPSVDKALPNPAGTEFDIDEETVFYTPSQKPQLPKSYSRVTRISNSKDAQVAAQMARLDYTILMQAELNRLQHPRIKRALARTAHKTRKLADSTAVHIPVMASGETAPKKKAFLRKPGSLIPRAGAYLTIAVVIIGTSYIGFDVWNTNNQLKNELNATAAALGSPNPSARQKSEGRDQSDVNKDMIQNYTVAPSMPRTITINKAHIQARVLPMDVNPDNSVQAPVNIFDAGWYTGSAKPGEPGAALIDGHSSGATRQGEFAYLDRLQPGDSIEVERGDGQKLTYEVVHTETIPVKDVNMTKLVLPYGENAQGLNLITCTGKYIKNKDGSFTYDHRALVYAKRVS